MTDGASPELRDYAAACVAYFEAEREFRRRLDLSRRFGGSDLETDLTPRGQAREVARMVADGLRDVAEQARDRWRVTGEFEETTAALGRGGRTE